eukprot:13817468-Alexandrium_andersonii.AAC.1
MSASLVGSEMCIRDRCYSVSRVLSLVPLPRLLGAHSVLEPPVAIGCRTCLLYTSDAADDM